MKYQTVLQHSEEDCGAVCLATVAKHYGRTFALNRIREVVGTGQRGTTLLGLRRGAETLGFNTRQIKVTSKLFHQLDRAPLPAIIHWKGYHWVVLYGKKGKKYVIADPAIGIRYLTRQELTAGWTNGIMLLLLPEAGRFEQQANDEVSGVWRFFKQAWPYRAILTEALLINIVVGVLSLATPFLFQILTDDVLVRGDTQLLTAVAIGVVTINLFSNIFQLVQSNLIAQFAQRLELGFVLAFGRQILRLPLSYYEARRSGEIVSRLRDIREINQLVSHVVISLPSQTFIGIVSFGFMLFYSWQLTAAATVLAVSMTLSTVIFLPVLRQKTRAVLVTAAENQGFLVETFKGALNLKTTNATPQAWEEIQSRFGRLANVTFGTIQISIINGVFSKLISGIGTVVILWLGSSLVIERELTIGQLLAFNSMNGNFAGLIVTFISFVDEFARAHTAIQRLGEVIDTTPEDLNDDKKPWAKISSEADITCTNLNFHHVGRVSLLKDFSLTIPGGKVTALIGKSGCGKSTLVKLIVGLYSLESGNIAFGGYNQKDLSLECLRQQVILVPQEPHFWSRSIIENFRFGTPYATFEQIVVACQIACADEFINQLPDKYQTVLGEFGANLSGGQRQRLSLAQAIVTDPPVLILDEATSALDPVLEAKVLDKLLFYRQNKTTILISHRSSAIGRANWIVLLEDGQLKLQDSIEKLRSQQGAHLDFLTGKSDRFN
ncbi:peptidase domain-containing ABC transporter [Pleurocapsales cyanobacterium LEGE 06147]|nr:peptidase domain-containing ABC transporter [Pleurocapsales cyanobacterium LEGE 06147]